MANEQHITQLQLNWGAQGYIIYPVVNGAYGTPIYGGDATPADAMAQYDEVASVKSTGEYEYRIIQEQTPTPQTGEAWAVKFITPCAGTLGGKEVAVEAKEETIKTLEEELEDLDPDSVEAQSLQDQIDAEEAAIDAINNGVVGDTEPGKFALMLACITLATTIDTDSASIEQLLEALDAAEQTFATAMGDLLQDGYYSDETYGPGQEQALYNDSVEMLKILSAPQNTYNLKEQDLANTPGYTDEVFTMNIAVHFYNELLNINDYGFVSQVSEYLDRANTRGVEIKTDVMNIQGKSFSSFLGRITDAAQIVKDKESIYDRAKALSKDGTMGTGKLDGMIDVLQNRLMSATSNWYTDDNGNLMFESADGRNAMMLCGSGFMVANGKNNDGNWNWRTFGTGEGFTADLITAGIVRAEIVTILGSDQFYWNSDNIYILDPNDSNKQIRIGRYDDNDDDKLGIGYTTDGGLSWQNAIDFNGIHLSAGDQAKIDSAGRGGHNYIPESLSILGTEDYPVDVDVFDGTCGTNLVWKFDTGVLTIAGAGAMTDFAYDGMPWYSNHANYSTLNLPVGLTHIGTWAFEFAWGLTSVDIPNTVVSIGGGAFWNSYNMTLATIPASVTTIANDAFGACTNLTIRCVEGSAADTYAQANDIPVEYM